MASLFWWYIVSTKKIELSLFCLFSIPVGIQKQSISKFLQRMAKLLLIMSLFLITARGKLLLKDDLKRDRAMLNEHGVYMDIEGKRKLKLFDKYVHMDPSTFKFSRRQIGKHSIYKWFTKNHKLAIYQIESILSGDSIYIQKNLTTGIADSIKLRKAAFKFRTYIINDSVNPQLLYVGQIDKGLLYFKVGKKVFSSVRESIALGVHYPSEEELLRIAAGE